MSINDEKANKSCVQILFFRLQVYLDECQATPSIFGTESLSEHNLSAKKTQKNKKTSK